MTGLRVRIVCGVLALAAGGVAAGSAVSAAGGDVRGLVRMSAEEPLGARVAGEIPDFPFVPHDARYDGRYFYAIALDPLAFGDDHLLIDLPAYRYGHPGLGWAAALFSLGMEPAVPIVLLVISLGALVVAAVAASILASDLGAGGWAGLTVAFNPGLLFAVATDTSEPLGAALIASGLVLWLRGKHGPGGVALACACLVKEPFVLIAAGLALWEIVEARRHGRPENYFGRLAILAAGPAALAAWFVYLHERLGVWSFSAGPPNLALPFTGWIDSFEFAGILAVNPDAHQAGGAAVGLLVASAGAVGYGIVRSVRVRNPGQAIFLLSGILVLCFAALALVYPKDLLRNLAVPLAFLPWVVWRGPTKTTS